MYHLSTQIIAALLTVVSQPVVPEAQAISVPEAHDANGMDQFPVQTCSGPSRTLMLFPAETRRNAGARATGLWLVSPRTSVPGTKEAAFPALGGPMELWRAEDGLFYVSGLVNGQSIRFLVDTGASMIVLTPEDARRVGAAQADNDAIVTETANGTSRMTRVTLASMQVGGTGASAVPAAVAQDGLKVSLLGQNWLSHLDSVRIDGDRMVLQ